FPPLSERELVKLSPMERSKLLAERFRQSHPEMFEDATAPDRSVSRRTPRHDNGDICAGKSGNSLASALAFEKAKLGRSEMYATLRELFHAHDDLTTKEIGELLGLQDKNLYAPRCSELFHAGVLV